MSWLFSRALVEEFSAATCLDGAQSALLSGNPMPLAFLPSDKMTAFSRPSRFGMTFAPLTATLGEAVLTWFLAGFHAKTSALPEKAQDWTENDPASGEKWRGWLAKYDPASSSWRTPQRSFIEDLDESSAILPNSGMTRGGLCWELPMLEPLTSATGSGLWVPTPIATEWKAGLGKTGNRAPEKAAKAGLKLGEFAKLWPTPTVCGNYNRKGVSATSVDGFATAIKIWATPVARDYRSPGRSRLERTGSKSGDPLPQQVGGTLNPTWVEWLMGWPLGWTDLRPLETGRFLFAQPQHSENSQGDLIKESA